MSKHYTGYIVAYLIDKVNAFDLADDMIKYECKAEKCFTS